MTVYRPPTADEMNEYQKGDVSTVEFVGVVRVDGPVYRIDEAVLSATYGISIDILKEIDMVVEVGEEQE